MACVLDLSVNWHPHESRDPGFLSQILHCHELANAIHFNCHMPMVQRDHTRCVRGRSFRQDPPYLGSGGAADSRLLCAHNLRRQNQTFIY